MVVDGRWVAPDAGSSEVSFVPLVRDPVFSEVLGRLEAVEALLYGIEGRLDSLCRDCGCGSSDVV